MEDLTSRHLQLCHTVIASWLEDRLKSQYIPFENLIIWGSRLQEDLTNATRVDAYFYEFKLLLKLLNRHPVMFPIWNILCNLGEGHERDVVSNTFRTSHLNCRRVQRCRAK